MPAIIRAYVIGGSLGSMPLLCISKLQQASPCVLRRFVRNPETQMIEMVWAIGIVRL